jgi:hypothetical protein
MRSRKFFSATVTLPANTPTSLLSLMQLAPLYWTFESDGTTLSLDSTTGSEASVTPEGVTYVGDDNLVRGDNAVSPQYRGAPVVANQNYSLQDFGSAYGIIDPNAVWLYSQSGTRVAIVFQAR